MLPLQGQLEVTTLKGTGAAADAEADLVERKPFFMLTLELPQARLFQDAVDKDIIPQVPQPLSPPPSQPALSTASSGGDPSPPGVEASTDRENLPIDGFFIQRRAICVRCKH